MGIQVSKFAGREQTATVEYQGDTATFTFLPNLLTPNKVQQVQNNAEDIETVAETIAEVVVEWDVIGEPAVNELLIAERVVEQAANYQQQGQAPQPFTVVQGRNRGPAGMYPLTTAALVQLPLGFLSAIMTAMFEAIGPKSKTKARS